MTSLQTKFSTWSYCSYTMAPEVLKGQYGKEADMWSIGVIAFMLLSSSMPFYGKSQKRVIKKILSG